MYARACATPISGLVGHSYLSSWYGLPLEDMANSIFLTGGFPRSKGGGREGGMEGWREEEECDSHRIERQTRSQTHRSWLRQAVIRVLLEARQRHVVLTSPGHRAALIHEHSCTAAQLHAGLQQCRLTMAGGCCRLYRSHRRLDHTTRPPNTSSLYLPTPWRHVLVTDL